VVKLAAIEGRTIESTPEEVTIGEVCTGEIRSRKVDLLKVAVAKRTLHEAPSRKDLIRLLFKIRPALEMHVVEVEKVKIPCRWKAKRYPIIGVRTRGIVSLLGLRSESLTKSELVSYSRLIGWADFRDAAHVCDRHSKDMTHPPHLFTISSYLFNK
jgi:hypothetical protein